MRNQEFFQWVTDSTNTNIIAKIWKVIQLLNINKY